MDRPADRTNFRSAASAKPVALRTYAAVGAAYLVAAVAARAFGVPQPLWPAAGIALAAVMVRPRTWPAVWLAAFLLYFGLRWTAATPNAILIAAAVATGAAAQAVVAAQLCRPALAGPLPLARDRDVVRFLLVGGTLGSVLSPTCTVLAATVAGQLAAADVARVWLSHWTADTLGVVLFAPLGLVATNDDARRNRAWIAVPLLTTAGLLAAVHVGVVSDTDESVRLYALVAVPAALLVAVATLGAAGRVDLTNAEVTARTADLARVNAALRKEAEERSGATAALEASERRYRSFLEAAPFAVLVQVEGYAVFFNQRAVSMFGGTDVSDFVGRPVLQFVDPSDQVAAAERLGTVQEDRSPTRPPGCSRSFGWTAPGSSPKPRPSPTSSTGSGAP